MEIVKEYNKIYPKNTIFWICEHKFILIELFKKNEIFLNEMNNKLRVLNFTENKLRSWTDEVNNCENGAFVIINRSFLVSKERYKNLINYPKLIIHDECHSIKNKTTQSFYNFFLENNYKFRAIGLSATPEKFIFPFDNIIDSYNLLDASLDNVIVKPKIYWGTDGNLDSIAKSAACRPSAKIVASCCFLVRGLAPTILGFRIRRKTNNGTCLCLFPLLFKTLKSN